MDDKQLAQYTTKEAKEQLGLIELHLKHYKSDSFCISCIDKHLANLGGLAKECVGNCSGEIWTDLHRWAEKTSKKTPHPVTVSREARQLRKRFQGFEPGKIETTSTDSKDFFATAWQAENPRKKIPAMFKDSREKREWEV